MISVVSSASYFWWFCLAISAPPSVTKSRVKIPKTVRDLVTQCSRTISNAYKSSKSRNLLNGNTGHGNIIWRKLKALVNQNIQNTHHMSINKPYQFSILIPNLEPILSSSALTLALAGLGWSLTLFHTGSNTTYSTRGRGIYAPAPLEILL